MADHDLTSTEAFLLKWLADEAFSQYGECHGKDLDSLIAKGLAQIHGPGEHQYFIAQDRTGEMGMMFRAVSLTEAGIEAARKGAGT